MEYYKYIEKAIEIKKNKQFHKNIYCFYHYELNFNFIK